MTFKIEQLQILQQEIENTIELSIETSIAVDLCRAFFYKNWKSLFSLAITEGAICLLIFVFILPISSIVHRSAGNLLNTATESNRFFALLAIIVFLSFVTLNFYLWQRVKQVDSLAKLLEEIDRYNSTVEEIERYNSTVEEIAIIQQINSTTPPKNNLSDREEIILFFQGIRQGLIDALKIERIARTRQDLWINRHELLTKIEVNLTSLVASDIEHRTAEYQHLVEETLRVGLAVRGEVQKLKQRL